MSLVSEIKAFKLEFDRDVERHRATRDQSLWQRREILCSRCILTIQAFADLCTWLADYHSPQYHHDGSYGRPFLHRQASTYAKLQLEINTSLQLLNQEFGQLKRETLNAGRQYREKYDRTMRQLDTMISKAMTVTNTNIMDAKLRVTRMESQISELAGIIGREQSEHGLLVAKSQEQEKTRDGLSKAGLGTWVGGAALFAVGVVFPPAMVLSIVVGTSSIALTGSAIAVEQLGKNKTLKRAKISKKGIENKQALSRQMIRSKSRRETEKENVQLCIVNIKSEEATLDVSFQEFQKMQDGIREDKERTWKNVEAGNMFTVPRDTDLTKCSIEDLVKKFECDTNVFLAAAAEMYNRSTSPKKVISEERRQQLEAALTNLKYRVQNIRNPNRRPTKGYKHWIVGIGCGAICVYISWSLSKFQLSALVCFLLYAVFRWKRC